MPQVGHRWSRGGAEDIQFCLACAHLTPLSRRHCSLGYPRLDSDKGNTDEKTKHYSLLTCWRHVGISKVLPDSYDVGRVHEHRNVVVYV